MSDTGMQQPNARDIDVRPLRPQHRHRAIFEAYEQLVTGESMVVMTDQEPEGLRKELDRELAGACRWKPLPSADDAYRVRLTKLASTALPRVVANTRKLGEATDPATGGSIWRLEPGARDLDSNIIALPAGDEIALHAGPSLDVLILVLRGSGELHTELDVIALQQGNLIWLPKYAQRRFVAGPDGMQYLTVHQRKPTLNITAAPDRS
ncbi:MAG: DUF2249 domain-containing protein [Micrococcaceae bacterium]|nr:DUF2249 domain-containing protein [Micrococcaceae bacterium]